MDDRDGTASGAAAVRRAAPAKINLYLHVCGRRDDGYHLLDSLVAFADVGDVVTAAPAPPGTLDLTVTGPFAPALAADGDDPADNLVLRAARRLAAARGITAPGAALMLEKNLPVASGIGGGSSDAAATLRALVALWRLKGIGEHELAEIGVALGADVPVCLAARPTWLGGIGEDLRPAPALPAAGIVLVNPGIPLPTPPVFRARSGPFSAPARFLGPLSDAADLAARLAERRNDLTAAAVGLVPAIADVLAALERSEEALIARMSGSGATCFALYAARPAAEAVAARLRAAQPGWWVAAGTLGTGERP
jgi:4-diphosphocytidyl-2-C-methyl-D-erythritol kinase